MEKLPYESNCQRWAKTGLGHFGLRHPIDTLRDKKLLEEPWVSGNTPWHKK
jgi:hypothetical protein